VYQWCINEKANILKHQIKNENIIYYTTASKNKYGKKQKY